MKQIKYILSIAVLVIFAAGCTNEDDFDSKNSKTNDKSLDKSDYSPLSPYPEYEQIKITDQEAMNLLVDFSKAMNKEGEMPDMEVNEALLAMEMYFNYAIVDKQVDYNKNEPYEGQEFEFTVNLDGKIVGTTLKTQYRDFLIEIKDAMANKFLRFSDMFVSAKTSSSITFKIIIPPYLDGMHDLNMAMVEMPSCPVVREVGDMPIIPEDVHIDIADYISGGQFISPNIYNCYPLPQLHSLCLNPLEGFVYGITSSFSDIPYFSDGYYFLVPYFTSYDNYFDNNDFEDPIVPLTLHRANQLRQTLDEGLTLLDVSPELLFVYNLGCKSPNGAMLVMPKMMSGKVILAISLTLNTNDITFVP